MNNQLFQFDLDRKTEENVNFIIGTDEAGRGPAAGGVWAAAVYFKESVDISLFEKLNDSKKLTPKKRDELYEVIKESTYFSIKAINVAKIEEINILQASLLAMNYAVSDVINQLNSNTILSINKDKNYSFINKKLTTIV